MRDLASESSSLRLGYREGTRQAGCGERAPVSLSRGACRPEGAMFTHPGFGLFPSTLLAPHVSFLPSFLSHAIICCSHGRRLSICSSFRAIFIVHFPQTAVAQGLGEGWMVAKGGASVVQFLLGTCYSPQPPCSWPSFLGLPVHRHKETFMPLNQPMSTDCFYSTPAYWEISPSSSP